MARKMRVDQINDLAKTPEAFIAQCEEDFTKEVFRLSETIREKNIHFVYISGPTSSGKTTFANTLYYYFKDKELVPISLDNYFVSQDTMKLRKDGTKDFETIKTLDLSKFRNTIRQIQEGEPLILPFFDFMQRKVIDNHTVLKPKKDAIYIIEGIHALNDKICGFTPKEDSIKVFVSPYGQIINENGAPYNRNDFRFLRRMIRDNFHRSAPPQVTFQMWESVRSGEKRYPYIKKADVLIDTFLYYEPCVLKELGHSLLESMEEKTKKAERLIKILNQFTSISPALIPKTSILNEFIDRADSQES